jgi:hypothetical protein
MPPRPGCEFDFRPRDGIDTDGKRDAQHHEADSKINDDRLTEMDAVGDENDETPLSQQMLLLQN